MHRTVIAYKDIPKVMVEALLAAEDKHYFEHHGVSPLGIMRATFVNIKSLHMREAAQQ
jgi:membrane carboxypeptidase/penicillin-binding protein